MHRKPVSSQSGGAPAWMNTYGDMITLVLTFFVLLYAFSVVDKKKLEDFLKSFASHVGSSTSQSEIADDGPIVISNNTEDDLEFDAIQGEMAQYLKDNNLEDTITLQAKDNGLLISFTDDVLFDSGKAEIKHGMQQVLYDVGVMFLNFEETIEQIRIEGHTDNVPIRTPEFSDNWELSTRRATTVIKFLIERLGIDAHILEAGGYSEYHPVADNNTEEGRERNRRVEIFLVKKDEVDEVLD